MAQDEELSFEAALQQLEGIVSRLDGGDLPLEEALALFQQGSQLREYCARKLAEAEAQVEALLQDTPEATEAPKAPDSLFGDD